jgi:hypothetical protein
LDVVTVKVKLLPLLLKSSVFLCLPSVVRGGSVTDRQQVETTYADLRPDDLVVDKTGKAWPIAEKVYSHRSDLTAFWLCDPVSKVKQHLMNKEGGAAVMVSRIPSHADEAAKLEAEILAGVTEAVTNPENLISMDEALANVATIVEPEPLVEYTATEYDAANTATDDQPVRLPAFESMTPLEQRSHLYLLHGVFSFDLKSREELAAMHAEAHNARAAGVLNSRHIPHVHEAA